MDSVLQPYQRGKIQLKNRLLLAPSGTATGDREGHITEETLRWFEKRSKYFGIAVTEHAAVDKLGVYHKNMITAADDSCLEGFGLLADTLHSNDCKCLIQLDHGGGWDLQSLRECLDKEKNPEGRSPADELSDADLWAIVEAFGKAALRAQKAGFDGIQIKACHVFLLGMLFSPLTNHRTEGRYTGSAFEGRSHMILDTLKCIKSKVRNDFIISVRIATEDFCEGGSTVCDTVRLAKELEHAGADIIDLSGGVKYYYTNPYSSAPGYFGEGACAVKKTVSVPVALTGGVKELEQADTLLKKEKADIIGVCRAVRENECWLEQELDKLNSQK